MLGLLLSLLGGLGIAGAASAGGGGSSDKRQEVVPEKLVPGKKPVEAPPVIPDAKEYHAEHIPDETMNHEDHAEHIPDETMNHEDHAEHIPDETMNHEDHAEHIPDETMNHEDHAEHIPDETMNHEDHAEHIPDETMNHEDHAEHIPDETMNHEDHAEHIPDETMDHEDHMGHHTPAVPLPTTPEEIDAFVAAVRSSPEVHSHGAGSSMASEHMAAMDLVPRDEASHIAIGNGDWDDPANWHNGEVPGDNATVLIPEGVHMSYDHIGAARVLTVRVDGHLDFATDTDSQLIVDTLVVSPSGTLTIGTEANPVDPNVNVDIIFANNGPIDTDWDPMLLSRGMIAHGTVEIHGAEKDSHEKVVDDPMAGDTWVDMGETPVGWAVGDTIIIAGTRYEGYYTKQPGVDYVPPEDEIRVISHIEDGRIFFDDPLVFDHATPRADLKTSVANYTRNVSFETENAETAEIYERGHVMFMHNDDVDVNYAEFHELGRTDKSETAVNVGDVADAEYDTNVKGRYSFHFHRAGLDDVDNPAVATGNAVYGSPGWGFVHHDSNAILQNNATYDTFGAGYVAESGNEIGVWDDNIAIFAEGPSFTVPKGGNDVVNFDLGKTGDGFWFQGRMVESTDNIAASVNTGFVYFHRGVIGENGEIPFDASTSEVGDILYDHPYVEGGDHPILSFSGNETFASSKGMWVLKGDPNQGHDVHSVLEDFTAWNVDLGAGLEYTSHYTLKNFDIIGYEDSLYTPRDYGITFGGNVSDMTIMNPTIENFTWGIDLNKSFTETHLSPELHGLTVIDATFIDVDNHFRNYDPLLDTVISSADLPYLEPDIILDQPLAYNTEKRWVELTGTKKDSLGETDFPGGTDTYVVRQTQVQNVLEENGYYTTSSGQDYFMMDIFFSDRVTGDIYYEQHPVLLDQTPKESGLAPDAVFNGVLDLGGPDDPTMDSAKLWATLTDGQIVFQEDEPAGAEEEAFLLEMEM